MRVHIGEARHFAAVSRDHYDIILISLLNSFAARGGRAACAAPRAHSTPSKPSPTYLDRLTPGGLLAITRWLNTPPRDGPRGLRDCHRGAQRRGVR